MANEKRLIDANALSKSIKEGSGTELQKFFADVCVATAPTVDAVPVVRGKWLDVFTGFNFFAATCSVCHKRSDLPPIAVAKYCPRCGARMDGDYE